MSYVLGAQDADPASLAPDRSATGAARPSHDHPDRRLLIAGGGTVIGNAAGRITEHLVGLGQGTDRLSAAAAVGRASGCSARARRRQASAISHEA